MLTTLVTIVLLFGTFATFRFLLAFSNLSILSVALR